MARQFAAPRPRPGAVRPSYRPARGAARRRSSPAHPDAGSRCGRSTSTTTTQVFEVFRASRPTSARIDRVVVNAGLGKGAPLGTGRYDANRQTAMTNFVAALAQTEAAMEIFRDAGRRPPRDGLVDVGDARDAQGRSRRTPPPRPASPTSPRACAPSCYGTPIKVTVLYPGYIPSEMNEQVDQKRPVHGLHREGRRARWSTAIEKEKASARCRRGRGCRWASRSSTCRCRWRAVSWAEPALGSRAKVER